MYNFKKKYGACEFDGVNTTQSCWDRAMFNTVYVHPLFF